MNFLGTFCFLSVMVLCSEGGAPLPPIPTDPPPTVPNGGGGCQVDETCETTYNYNATNSDPCQAARQYKTCAEAARDACNGEPTSDITTIVSHAQDKVTEHCQEPPPGLPQCASQCKAYEDEAIARWATAKLVEGCAAYDQYKTCLNNHEVSGSCTVTSFITSANTEYITRCSLNCSTAYTACTTNLPELANDQNKLQELCEAWWLCKTYDFSPCSQSLALNYDTQCESVTPLPSLNSQTTESGNGSTRLNNSIGLLMVVTVVFLLFC